MGEDAILHTRVLGARHPITGWPSVAFVDSTIEVMVKRMSVMVRDTTSGTVEEVRGRLYTLSEIHIDDEVTYDGVRWRVEDVQFKHILLSELGYFDCMILTPRQLYPSVYVAPNEVDVFFPVMDPDAAYGSYPVISLANGATETVYHNIKLPEDFISLVSVNVLIIPAGNGKMYRQAGVQWGKICAGESANNETGSLSGGTLTVTDNIITCISLAAPITGSEGDDLIGVYFSRLGAHPSDTVDASCYYAGIVLRYSK